MEKSNVLKEWLSLTKFFKEMASILETSSHTISAETKLTDHTWDSLAWVETAELMNGIFGISISLDELHKCETLGDLSEFGKKKAKLEKEKK